MKEITEAKKTLILLIIIAVVLFIVAFTILEDFGCMGCNLCGDGSGGILKSCFNVCSGCAKCGSDCLCS